MKNMKVIFIFLIISIVSIVTFIKLPQSVSKTSSLTGKIIFIDPGHGGKDDGASRNGVLEDEINLHIASYLFECLLDQGAQVLLTRSGDYDLASLYATNRKREDLRKRVETINGSGANFFISLHVNALNNEAVNGPMVYYKKRCEDSLAIAKSVALELNEFANVNKPLHEENYYLFEKTKIPGVLIESGFISNSGERNKLINDSYQRAIAQTICRGILNYFTGIKT